LDTSSSTPSLTYSAYRIETADVPAAWPEARPFIETVLSASTATGELYLEDIYVRLLMGETGPLKASLWVIRRGDGRAVGAAVTQFVTYERRTVLQIPYLSGRDFSDWAYLIRDVQEYAMEIGADAIELLARDGFGKALDAFGIKKMWTMFRIPVA